MPSRTLLTVLFALSACGDDAGGDDSNGTATAITAGSISGVSMSGVTAAGETTAGGTTSETGDSETLPETTVMSLTSGFDTADECDNVLHATIRDFMESHPDFEYKIGDDLGIVLPDLGADGLPVYAGLADNPTTNGQEYFDQWYRDVPDVNQSFPLEIALMNEGNGQYTYDNSAFFPIDNVGWGNEGNEHNYHFTLELHTVFTYKGGEVFTFRGDDDLFVFINKKLAIDLGGVHGPQMGSAVLDELAGPLGILPGNEYTLDFFFAERHLQDSNFRIETTIGCLAPPVG